MSPPTKVIAIVGPTASGKSALAVAIAKRFNGEVISADSRQVYRGMDIGTGKITGREMRGVPHHLLDVASPRRTFTAAQYQKLASAALREIAAKGKLPVVTGGAGFYIDALLYDYRLPAVKPNAALRKKLEQESAEALFARLRRADPRRAAAIDCRNKRRLARALEIVAATKRPVPSAAQALAKRSHYNVMNIGLRPTPAELKKKIRARLRARLRDGMLREVEWLHEKGGLSWRRLDSFGLEYRYASRYLRGMITKTDMVRQIEKESWRYAKRQMRWLRRNNIIHWITAPRRAFTLSKKFLALTT